MDKSDNRSPVGVQVIRWKVAQPNPILDTDNSKFLERDIYIQHLCYQDSPMENSGTNSEVRRGNQVCL